MYAVELKYSIPVEKGALVRVDDLGQIYVVSQKRTIHKYNLQLELLDSFRAIKNGEILVLDVNNPMEIIYYQPGFKRMTYLDRLFAPKLEIDFTKLGTMSISSVGQSLDGNFWVYDMIQAQLVKFNKNYLEISRSNELQLTGVTDFEPQLIEETSLGILVFQKNKGWILFDRYANWIQSDLEQEALINLHHTNAWIEVYDNYLIVKAHSNGDELLRITAQDQIIDAYVYKDYIIVLESQKLLIYQ